MSFGSPETDWGIVGERKVGNRIELLINRKKVRYWYRGGLYKEPNGKRNTYEMDRFLWRKFENALFLSRPKDFLIFNYQ